MQFTEYVPDYILRNYLKVGQTVTILDGSLVHVQLPKMPTGHSWSYTQSGDKQVMLTNFLPGHTDVYANEEYVHEVHNHQVVWIVNNSQGEPWEYHSTDINNVKEIRNA